MLTRYMDSVPKIIPLLEKEYCSTTRKLNEINKELRFVIQFILKRIFVFLEQIFLWTRIMYINC